MENYDNNNDRIDRYLSAKQNNKLKSLRNQTAPMSKTKLIKQNRNPDVKNEI